MELKQYALKVQEMRAQQKLLKDGKNRGIKRQWEAAAEKLKPLELEVDTYTAHVLDIVQASQKGLFNSER